MPIKMNVPMKRGGSIPMLVEGTFQTDTLGSGESVDTLEIYGVFFESHPKKDMSHIVDMERLKEEFKEKVESDRKNAEVDRMDWEG